MPDFAFEKLYQKTLCDNVPSLVENGNTIGIAGVDEAGCGPWAGPVVAAAVMFNHKLQLPEFLRNRLADSKKLSQKKREETFDRLTNSMDCLQHVNAAIKLDHGDKSAHEPLQGTVKSPLAEDTDASSWHWAIGIASVVEIDTLNIRQATMLAMQRAVQGLPQKPSGVLVDGIAEPTLGCSVQTLKKGDALSCSIAAASIIAKVFRDAWMKRLSQLYPQYHWDRNKGYGTAHHQNAIVETGITPHHRFSFKPVAALWGSTQQHLDQLGSS